MVRIRWQSKDGREPVKATNGAAIGQRVDESPNKGPLRGVVNRFERPHSGCRKGAKVL